MCAFWKISKFLICLWSFKNKIKIVHFLGKTQLLGNNFCQWLASWEIIFSKGSALGKYYLVKAQQKSQKNLEVEVLYGHWAFLPMTQPARNNFCQWLLKISKISQPTAKQAEHFLPMTKHTGKNLRRWLSPRIYFLPMTQFAANNFHQRVSHFCEKFHKFASLL